MGSPAPCRHLSGNAQLAAEPPPHLGQHTREILEGLLDYSSADVDTLAAEGVVQLTEPVAA